MRSEEPYSAVVLPMNTDQSKRGVWPTIFAGTMLLATCYGTAYWWLVRGRIQDGWDFVGGSPHPPATLAPDYPYDWLVPLFAPAHLIDRYFIRREYWNGDFLEVLQ